MAAEQLIWIPLKEELEQLCWRTRFDPAFSDIPWADIELFYWYELVQGVSSSRHRFEGIAVEDPFKANFMGVLHRTIDRTACTVQMDVMQPGTAELHREKPRRIKVCQQDSQTWYHRRVDNMRRARSSVVQSTTISPTISVGSAENFIFSPHVSHAVNTNIPPAGSASRSPEEQPRPEAAASEPGPQLDRAADADPLMPGHIDRPDETSPESSAARESTPVPVPAKSLRLAVNGTDRDFTLVDLTKPPASPGKFSNQRLSKEGLHRATDDECDTVIRLVAASDDGGKTNESMIRLWSRPLLRQLLQADTTADIVAERFLKSPLHVELRRTGGNPNVLRG